MIKATIQVMIACAVLTTIPFVLMYIAFAALVDIIRLRFEFTPWILGQLKSELVRVYKVIKE